MKKIIIIGATSGIGRGLAELFVKKECHVGIVGRRENLLREIHSQSENYFYSICDITQSYETIKKLDKLIDEMGGMDILIVSSGVGELNPSLDYLLEEPTVLTNVLGFTNIACWAFNYFEKQKSGHLVIISSVGGIRGSSVSPAYNASKSYQINYTEGLIQKAAKLPFSIHITDIRPGFIDTAMAKGDGLFWVISINKAVNQIYKAIQKKKKIVYVSKRWKLVSILLKLLPSFIYRKM